MELRERALKSLETLKGPGTVAAAAMPLEDDKGREGAILDIMELWARDLMAGAGRAEPYQAGELARLQRTSLDGRALLLGVMKARSQLQGNVSWPNALENMYFHLIETGNNGRTQLSWQR